MIRDQTGKIRTQLVGTTRNSKSTTINHIMLISGAIMIKSETIGIHRMIETKTRMIMINLSGTISSGKINKTRTINERKIIIRNRETTNNGTMNSKSKIISKMIKVGSMITRTGNTNKINSQIGMTSKIITMNQDTMPKLNRKFL